MTASSDFESRITLTQQQLDQVENSLSKKEKKKNDAIRFHFILKKKKIRK